MSTAKKRPNKQKEVRAASFLRIAKAAREKVCDCKPGQDTGRDLVRTMEWFAEIFEGEAKMLRGMR